MTAGITADRRQATGVPRSPRAGRIGRVGIVVAAAVLLSVLSLPPTGGATPLPSGTRESPEDARVVGGRFVSTVELDGGAVIVVPAPPGIRPRMGESKVETQLWATSQLLGYRAQALGFGIVTIARRQPGIPRVVKLSAWVGFATVSGVSYSCPAMIVRPHAPTLPHLSSAGDAAVVVGDADGAPAVVYKARSAPCDSVVAPSLTRATEVFSIPWVPIGPVGGELLQVQASLPGCGDYAGNATGGSAAAMTVTLYALVPESLRGSSGCGIGHVDPETIMLGPGAIPGAPPPLVSPSRQILHGTIGPVRAVSPPQPLSGRPPIAVPLAGPVGSTASAG